MIRSFTKEDIKAACNISGLVWGDTYKDASLELQKLIYDFTVEYYDRNRDYSIVYDSDGLKGFILSFQRNDEKNLYDNYESKVNLLKSKSEQKIALELYAYVENCGRIVKDLMRDEDLMLGLFVSIQKGCGRALLSELKERCTSKGIRNIYLWTDTTCDCEYYKHNKFDLLKEMSYELKGKVISMQIYKMPIIN